LNETLRLSLREVKGWLESETSQVLVPMQVKAQKFMEKMDKGLKDLDDICRMLLDNSRKEIEKKNMRTFGRARALNKLAKLFIERFHQLKPVDKPSYGGFKEFVESAQKAFAVTDFDVRNWFPKISPFFIMDRGRFIRSFEKAKESLKELSDFLTKEYVKAKILEETFQLIEEVKKLNEQSETLNEEKIRVENERARIEGEIAEIQRKMNEVKRSGGLGQLSEINLEIETLNRELEHSLRHLLKPLIKLHSLAIHGEGSSLTPEEVKKLNHYLENPFEAFATEQPQYPILRQLLQKLAKMMANGRLKIKQDKERKAKQAIIEIVDRNSLVVLHQKCVTAKTRREKLSTSSVLAETKSELLKLEEHLERLEKKVESLKSEENRLDKSLKENFDKISEYKSKIEKNILDSTGKKVKME
jgi:predicted nuclease with TOPRIM domain